MKISKKFDEINLLVEKTTSIELKDLTGSDTLLDAVQQAIKFTLMHDKDSVTLALKEG